MTRLLMWWRLVLLLTIVAGVPFLAAQEPGAAKGVEAADAKKDAKKDATDLKKDAAKGDVKDAKKDAADPKKGDVKDAKKDAKKDAGDPKKGDGKDTKKDAKKDAKKEESEKPEKMEKAPPPVPYIKQGLFVGKIADVRESDRNFAIDVAAGKGKNIKLSFAITDDVKIRTMNMPLTFDDRGNLKRPSRDEMIKAKGKDKDRYLPGFEADFSTLTMGQIVQVQAVTTKEKAIAARDKALKYRPIPGQPPPPPEDILTNMVIIVQDAQKKPGQGK